MWSQSAFPVKVIARFFIIIIMKPVLLLFLGLSLGMNSVTGRGATKRLSDRPELVG